MHKLILALTATFALSAVTSYSVDAHAGSRKQVRIEFKNAAHSQKMRCKLDKLVRRGSRTTRSTVKRFVIDGAQSRPEDVRHLPVVKYVSLAPVVKTLAGTYVYPDLQMTCALDDNSHAGNEATSSRWSDASQSFDDHFLDAYCNHGTPCSVIVAD
jgi:hypothetical protein